MKLLDLSERDDVIEPPLDLGTPHAQDRTAQVDVLATGQLLVEARAHLEQRPDTTMNLRATLRWHRHAREQLEKGRLAGAVPAYQTDHLTLLDLERSVPQRPEFAMFIACSPRLRRKTFESDSVSLP